LLYPVKSHADDGNEWSAVLDKISGVSSPAESSGHLNG